MLLRHLGILMDDTVATISRADANDAAKTRLQDQLHSFVSICARVH